MDLIDDPTPGANTPEFTVSEVAGSVKKLIEAEFGWVRIKGEVGRVVLARSGHLYFDLKDDRSVLSCMSWKGQVPGLGMMPEEGMEVIAEGKMTASGFQSKFALNAQRIAVAGAGALMALLEKRKATLAAEGLFAPERKQELPYLPDVIGVVTSTEGAVIRDILHRLRDRFPRKVLVWPVAVQGAKCKDEVAAAIRGFNGFTPGGALPRPDLLIVARGGGSIEDLWGFNEEIVARAAAESVIPLISAVGHETDTTLIDFVSDMRAPTPTAAAEIAVPVRMELLAWVDEQNARLRRALTTGVDTRKQRMRDLARALPRPDMLLANPAQRLDLWGDRLPKALILAAGKKRQSLSEVSGALRPSLLARKQQAETQRLADQARHLEPALQRSADRHRIRLDGIGQRFALRSPQAGLAQTSERFMTVVKRLSDVATRDVEQRKTRLEALDRLRQTVGYKETLQRGYTVVRSGDTVIKTQKAAKDAGALEIEFSDGRLSIGGTVKLAKKPKPQTPPEQGSLL
jgi:exodeoxyribonuclease VII large subunit